MKKTIILLAVVAMMIAVVGLNAEDEVKFPGKIGIEFKQQMDFTTEDGLATGGALGEGDAVYSRTEMKAKVGFKLANGVYTITPWIKERLELRMNLADDNTLDTIDTVKFRGRNRLYMGVNNTIAIDGIVDIGINLEARFANDLKPGKFNRGRAYEFRLSPVLALSGEYDFGLSWALEQYFNFYLDPSVTGDDVLAAFELDGVYGAGFEFFQYFAPKNFSGSFGIEDALTIIMNPSFSTIDTIYTTVENELVAGFSFGQGGLSEFIGLYLYTPEQNPADIQSTYLGFQLGVGFKKEMFSFSCSYTGAADVQSSNPQLESNVSTAVKIKL
jgi:hypothetical protein